MRSVCLLMAMVPLLSAQAPPPDGAALYKERCATCHDAPEGRIPAISAIRQMTGENIYGALTSGVMKTQAAGLSTPQLIALIVYIGPTGPTKPAFEKTCTGNTPFKVEGNSVWGGWSPSVTNSRFADAKVAGLTAADVPKLKLKWAFNLGSVTMGRGQPAVGGNRVFFGTQAGDVYAIDATSGCIHWSFKAPTGVRSGVSVGEANGEPAIFFSDGGATTYALNAATGQLLWKRRAVDHIFAISTASPQFYKGVLYQGYSSIEEAIAADPNTVCCNFRGSVVALDPSTGKTIWQSFTIAEPSKATGVGKQQGPSGAGIWSTPTIDEQRGALYVSTGDNYSNPTTETSDAVLAFDLKTGKMLWSSQLTKGDAYNIGCSTPERTNCKDENGPDFDFGQPPILVSLGGGKRALVIAQKSGLAHAIDPDANGKILWQTRAGVGGMLGGSQWGSAADSQSMYVAISDVAIGAAANGSGLALDPKMGGGLHAINLKSGKITWSAKPATCPAAQVICSPAQSAAVTAIPGAIFSGAVDGHLRAYSSKDGKVIWDVDTAREFPTVNGKPAHGGSIDATGAAVVGGTVFVNSGYSQWGGMPGNLLLAFSVNGK